MSTFMSPLMITAAPLRALALAVAAASVIVIPVAGRAAGAGEQSTLERPALTLRQPQRAAILATARAGQRIIAVGERGVALWSEDEGRSWHQAKVPVSVTLTAVSFAGDRSGWAVGHGAVILHTSDGGSSWARQYDGNVLSRAASASLQRSGANPVGQEGAADPHLVAVKLLAESIADKPLLDVQFVDAKTGFAAGACGLLLSTQDGGETWLLATQKLANPKALHLNTVRTRGRRVLIAGEQGTAYLSIDGGESFRPLTTSYRGSYLAAALLPSGGMALAGLRGNLLVSTDSGKAWTTVKLPTDAVLTVLDSAGDGELRVGAQSGQIFTYRLADHTVHELSLRGPPMLATLMAVGDGALVAGGLRGIERLDVVPAAKP